MRTPPSLHHRPDPFDRFRRDHAFVLARLEPLEREVFATGGSRDESLLRTTLGLLQRQFATHMRAEEAVLFPAIALAFPAGRATLETLRADHLELRLMLDASSRWLAARESPERAEQLQVALRDLIDLLRLHIHREEAAVFDVASRVLSDEEAANLARHIAPLVDSHPLPGSEPGSPKGTAS